MSPQYLRSRSRPLDNSVVLESAVSRLSREATEKLPGYLKVRPLLPPLAEETSANHPWSSSLGPLFLTLPLGEGWGEGLPGNHPGVTQMSPLGVGWSLPRTRSGGEGLRGNHRRVMQTSLFGDGQVRKSHVAAH